MPQLPKSRSWPVPAARTLALTRFAGVDLTSGPLGVEVSRSPDAPNLRPDENGFPVKRTGYHLVCDLFAGGPDEARRAVRAAFVLRAGGAEFVLVQAGGTLYRLTAGGAEVLYTGMAETPAAARQLGERLFLLDGRRMLVAGLFDGALGVRPADTLGTVPVYRLGCQPAGGNAGGVHRQPNLLTPWLQELYTADGAAVVYQLGLFPLLADAVRAEVLENGSWRALGENTDFTVDRAAGRVTFAAAPPAPAAAGEDNLRFTYAVARDPGPVNRCRLAELFGVGGALDRLFVAGDPEHPAQDRYSEYRDPLYFGLLDYSALGSESAPITGYGKLGTALLTYKRGEPHRQNIFLRTGTLSDAGTAQFLLADTVQGEGCLGPCGALAGEPLYLGARGFEAVTSADLSSRRISENRSYYLNGALTRAAGLENAPCCAWDRFLVLAAGGRLYLLDGAQRAYEKNAPESAFQYEGYYWTGIDAAALWTQDGRLRFGDAAGRIWEFWDDRLSRSYDDGTVAADDGSVSGGRPIEAYWTTPLLTLSSMSRQKTVTAVTVLCQPYTRSGAEIWYASDREFAQLARSFNLDVFDFNDIDFARWTFNALDRPALLPAGKKAKKVRLFSVRVRNARASEPFGVAAVQIDYRMGGKIRA